MAGAKVFRSWWNRTEETWWADVRFCDGESSVAEDMTRQEAEYAALCRAVVASGGQLA